MVHEYVSYCKAIDPDVTHRPPFKLMAQPLRVGTEMLDLLMKNRNFATFIYYSYSRKIAKSQRANRRGCFYKITFLVKGKSLSH